MKDTSPKKNMNPASEYKFKFRYQFKITKISKEIQYYSDDKNVLESINRLLGLAISIVFEDLKFEGDSYIGQSDGTIIAKNWAEWRAAAAIFAVLPKSIGFQVYGEEIDRIKKIITVEFVSIDQLE